MPGVTMPLKVVGPMSLLSFLPRPAVYGTDRTRGVGEVAPAAGGAAGLLGLQAYDSYEFERMPGRGGRGQRLRVREPVPRPGRRAAAPGRGGELSCSSGASLHGSDEQHR